MSLTGIGGIFIKCKDPQKMNLWYKDVLKLNTNDYGVLFKVNHQIKPVSMQLGTFKNESTYFGSPQQQYMLNFRVKNLDEFVIYLKTQQVKFIDEIERFEYGNFVHIEDPEGNRVELWEPTNEDFEGEGFQLFT